MHTQAINPAQVSAPRPPAQAGALSQLWNLPDAADYRANPVGAARAALWALRVNRQIERELRIDLEASKRALRAQLERRAMDDAMRAVLTATDAPAAPASPAPVRSRRSRAVARMRRRYA